MLRNRSLTGVSGSITLSTVFYPDQSSNDLNEEVCGVEIRFSPTSCIPLSVHQVISKWESAKDDDMTPVYYPLCSLSLLSEEMNFLLNLLKSLNDA